jgi:hypothetical protein
MPSKTRHCLTLRYAQGGRGFPQAIEQRCRRLKYRSALTGLEPRIFLVDDIGTPAPADHPAILVAFFEGAQ